MKKYIPNPTPTLLPPETCGGNQTPAGTLSLWHFGIEKKRGARKMERGQLTAHLHKRKEAKQL
jgi:hypothetical protein